MKPFAIRSIVVVLISLATLGQAQLTVNVSRPSVIDQKAIVPLALRNGLPESIQSARAVVFLVNEQGKVVAQSTRWIIGAEPSKSGLAPGATNVFQFVITGDKPFPTTNLSAKLTVSRIVLEGGKPADVNRDVKVEPAKN